MRKSRIESFHQLRTADLHFACYQQTVDGHAHPQFIELTRTVCIYTVYDRILVNSLPKRPCIHRIYLYMSFWSTLFIHQEWKTQNVCVTWTGNFHQLSTADLHFAVLPYAGWRRVRLLSSFWWAVGASISDQSVPRMSSMPEWVACLNCGCGSAFLMSSGSAYNHS